MTDRQLRITELWTAVNRQDFEAAIALLHPDVDWQDIVNGGRLHGIAAVRAYWTRISELLTSDSSPITYRLIGEDRIAARMLHSLTGKQGKVWGEEALTQVFTLRDGLIVRMDLDEG
ncbi:MAG: nuclear transport factor 2 family protein [Caulobacter sp.]|nr:nuclear transport factor 2 family protein [Caulobacter sp.]